MVSAVQPMVKTTYTEKGNEYKESNIGKYAAGAAVTGTAAVYGGEKAFKGAKTLYGKAKIIKMELPNFLKNLKPETKKVVTVSFSEKGASILVNTKKVNNVADFIKENAKKVNLENLKKVSQTVVDFIKTNAKKVNFGNIKKAVKSTVDYAKTNAKKINMKNIKKVGTAVVEFAKKPSVEYAAGVAVAIAGVLALGIAADYIANKISAKKADKV